MCEQGTERTKLTMLEGCWCFVHTYLTNLQLNECLVFRESPTSDYKGTQWERGDKNVIFTSHDSTAWPLKRRLIFYYSLPLFSLFLSHDSSEKFCLCQPRFQPISCRRSRFPLIHQGNNDDDESQWDMERVKVYYVTGKGKAPSSLAIVLTTKMFHTKKEIIIEDDDEDDDDDEYGRRKGRKENDDDSSVSARPP